MAQTILVRRTGAMGDVLETTAIVRRLREENPIAFITVETQHTNVYVANDDVSGVIPLLEVRYERTIDLNGAFESRLRKLHPIDTYSEVAFGDRATPRRLYFNFHHYTPVNSDRPLAVLHAARSWPIRTLPHEFWQDLIVKLGERGFNVVLTGTAQDHDGLVHCMDMRGKLNLAQQAALIDSAAIFVCSESGPMILAQVTSTPIIALLTMIDPAHILHDGADVTCIRANVPCVGCALEQPAETTYFDCKFGHRNCVTSFDPNFVAELAFARSRR